MKMDNSVKVTLIVVVGVIVLGLVISSSIRNAGANTVSVTGQSTIDVMPDLVAVYFMVSTTGATSKEAADKNSNITQALTNALLAQGFDQSEIETQSYSVYPEYDYSSSSQRLKDYLATHSIKVKIDANNTGKIGDVVNAGISAGAGISYIDFELTQESQNTYKKEALAQASQDATSKAQAVAQGLGKNLGSLVSVTVNDYNYMPWLAYNAAGATTAEVQKAAPSIQPSTQQVTASVTAVYRI